MTLNQYERGILKILAKKRRNMTINAISKETKFSRVTVKKYVKGLYKKGYLARKGKMWKFKFKLLK